MSAEKYDLEQEWAEYPKYNYVKSIQVIKKDPEINYAELKLTTLEDKVLNLAFTVTGIVDLQTSQKYQTFQSLLRKHSPGYTKQFNNSLLAKLQQLQQAQQSDSDD